MCGITGIYRYDGKHVSSRVLNHMTSLLRHRGPDDGATKNLGKIGLGHRRLSIIDLSKKGRQPMPDHKKKVWITFNGEMYNYQEVKKELQQQGYHFSSKSDTEVILKGYQEWGIDTIGKFNGMFAFALYDSNKDELFLVRDRLGIKPLYYSIVNNTLIFASEIKAILAYPKFKKELNKKAVSSYLSYRYEIGEETPFRRIFKLLPGHYLHVKGRRTHVHQYYDIPLTRKKVSSFSKSKKQLANLLNAAVKKRMISDVPVGAYLSGGLDSSIIVGLMSKHSKQPVKTFSIGFGEKKYNEFEYAKQVAERYKTNHKEIILPMKNYFQTMKKLIKFKDLPLSVPNEVAIFLLSKELKKDITVVLSGEGADELFSGYGRIFRSPLDYKKMKLFPLFFRKKLGLRRKYGSKQFKNRMDHFLHNYSYFPLEEKTFLFNDEMNNLIEEDNHLKAIFSKHFERSNKLSYHDQIGYVFEKVHLAGLLQRLDCPTMAASVEGRVPFVDHELVKFMFTVPQKHKLKWKSAKHSILSLFESSDDISEKRDVTKHVLRETFKHMLPESVIKRRKKGFPVPLDIWFRGPFITFAKKELLNKKAKIRVIMNQAHLEKWIDRNLEGKNPSFGQKLWMLLNLEYWLKTYFPSMKT